MRALTLDQVSPPMRLGRSLYAGDGRVLLHRGTELSEKYVDHLRTLGYDAVYVQDDHVEDVFEADMIAENTRILAMGAVKDAFTAFKSQRGQKFSHDWSGRRALYNAASSIVSEIQANKDLCFQMMELRSSDGWTFAHSVNVCVLGMALARKLEISHTKLVDLAIGLLLHDIGIQVLPEALRDPNRDLKPDERAEYETHCQGGYGLLKSMRDVFGAPIKIVSLQHHECWDGSGYPRGLMGNEIHEFAQICAIVDTYDRLTTSKAFGKKALPHEALEYLMGSGGRQFSLPMVQAFISVVAPYPIGVTVRLNTGEAGVVTHIPSGLPQRPTLRLVGAHEHEQDAFDLVTHTDRVIVGVVEDLEGRSPSLVPTDR